MKKGFTLIELLAVIVILAIIALIATPIILGIINDAREESNERSVELYASAVRNGIAAYQLRTGNEVLPVTYNESNPLPFKPDYEGNVKCTNVIISEDGKVSLDKCTVNGGTKEYSYGMEEESIVAQACTLSDEDGDGVASLSDIVTCGTESFYVMYNKNNKITMLSMYNLNVGNNTYSDGTLGIQNENVLGDKENYTTFGVLNFHSEPYWSSDTYPVWVYNEKSNLYQYVNEYERILINDLGVSSASATLMSYEQLYDLGCDGSQTDYGNFEGDCLNAPNWVYSTTYWTGSAESSTNIYYVNSWGYFYPDYYYVGNYAEEASGVRPVITISTSEIQ